MRSPNQYCSDLKIIILFEKQRTVKCLKRKQKISELELEMPDFSLSEYVTRFQTKDKSKFHVVDDPSTELNHVIDRIATSPEQIEDSEVFDTLVDLCQCFPSLSSKIQSQIVHLITSSSNNLIKEINGSLMGESNFSELINLLPSWKNCLEAYGYYIHVILFFLQEHLHKISNSSAFNKNKKAHSALTGQNSTGNKNIDDFKRIKLQIELICESIISILETNLFKIIETTPQRDLFIGLFIRPLFLLIEIEIPTKIASLKILVQRIICLSVKQYGQSANIQNAIMSNLTYFSHLSNFIAELLTSLNKDYAFPQISEEVLKEISGRVFNPKDTTGPKSIALFLVRLSELSPLLMLKQMSSLIQLLNNSSMTLRSAIVEACGNIIVEVEMDISYSENHKQQKDTLIALLEERFQDSNPYVRTKAIQACIKLIDLDIKINEKKDAITKLAVRSLNDRSPLVRRNAIKLLSKLLLKHPFVTATETQLKLSKWNKRLKEAEEKLSACEPTDSTSITSAIESPVEEAKSLEAYGTTEQSNLELDVNERIKSKLLVIYYRDAVNFIESIHEAIRIVSTLLLSKNRNEVLEAMDFLVLTDAYDMELSSTAVKKMLHLVWVKGTNEEGKSISSHLIDCYKQLFLTVPQTYTQIQSANYIATNLIRLACDASLADLTSLEKLLCMMYEMDLLGSNVIKRLWEIYHSEVSPQYTTDFIHGSIIILGMLALTDPYIVTNGFKLILKVGLGERGSKDLVLCKYSCIAVSRLFSYKEDEPKTLIDEISKKDAVKKLYSKIISYSCDSEYYPMCEEAIKALFHVSSESDVLCADLLKEKTMMTFGTPNSSTELATTSSFSPVISLSQLLFIVGQIAVRLLVYIDKCELKFKKRKMESELKKNNGKSHNSNIETGEQITEDRELEMIGGTNEDDFADAVQLVKESELLFGENALLGKFCPLVEDIVSNTTRFNDVFLQRVAALCLEKLMCISSKYCEKCLPLLITIMEKSTDPIIRSNAVLGFGDLAVCFNNLIDDNIDYLYGRLHDDNITVQKTCLMTITFLILAGQVKVKGQLGEMAKCLENSDQNISDMCRLFFTELSTKDNAIYNGFIDIFSTLSADDNLEFSSFKKIIKFLLSFIDKDKHQKQLSTKLLNRLSSCTTEKQWDEIAFVLNNIPLVNENPKIKETLQEGFKKVSAR